MSRRNQQRDFALQVLLRKALEQRPIIADGSPLTAAYAAQKYELPEHAVAEILDGLVKDGIAVKVNNGYTLSEVTP